MSNGSKTWRAAAIGHTGHGGYGHGLHTAYKGLPGVEMVAVADPDDQGRRQGLEQTGAARGYADYREMLEKEELDVVSVCPRHTIYHRDLVVDAANAGCHIYCEKAFARDLEEADAMIEACERNNVRIAVSHQARYVEPFITVREMVRRGDLGQLRCIHGRGKEDSRGGGEDLNVLGTHVLDIMRYLAGDPAWIFAYVTDEGRDVTREDAREPTEPIGPVAGDAVSALYAFPNGVRGTFTSIRGQSQLGPRMGVHLVGTEGELVVQFGGRHTAKRSRKPAAPGEATEWEELDLPDEPTIPGATSLDQTQSIPRGNRLAVWDLMRAAEEEREPISSGRDARDALEMILGVYASHLEGRRLPFPLEDRRHPLDPR